MLEERCAGDARRSAVRDHPTMNGIDCLEVRTLKLPDGSYPNPLLIIHCFKKVSGLGLGRNNIFIGGGVRVTNVIAEWAYDAHDLATSHQDKVSADELVLMNNLETPENVLVARASSRGDFSIYELRLVNSVLEPDIPAAGFDELLSKSEFSFKVECESDFDCLCRETEQQEFEEPPIDYMAKDYSSFRKLVMDRLSLIMPDWKERNPSDTGVMLVELLAYIGDHLSYFQDAVSTEAYLGTARKRISAARHAILLDYNVDEGCNARTWVCFKTRSDGLELKKGTVLLTANSNDILEAAGNCLLENDWNPIVSAGIELEEEIAKGSEAFETMYDITLYKDKHRMSFYTWGETDCWLLAGSTSASLKNAVASINLFTWEDIPGRSEELLAFLRENFELDWLDLADVTNSGSEITVKYEDNFVTIELDVDKANLYINNKKEYELDVEVTTASSSPSMHIVKSSALKVGDVLIFEEIVSTSKGSPPDPAHRYPVRITSICTTTDELTGAKVLEMKWDIEDALPFPLCLIKDGQEISVARGNITLADHGYTRTEELELEVAGGRYYPRLARKPVTYSGPAYDPSAGSAKSAFSFKPSQIKPIVSLVRENDPRKWEPQRDPLSSDESVPDFVVETEIDGTSYIRFSNFNRREWGAVIEVDPKSFRKFTATYRIGKGEKGNVGSCSITRIIEGTHHYSDIVGVTNLMAALGGRDAETIESVRQHAPQAFRKQERAVTEDDYTEVLKRHPQVQHAIAQRRWTGSWYTFFVTVDRLGNLGVDSEFQKEIADFLDNYRLAGYDLEIRPPNFVPLKISMDICTKEGFFEGEVKEQLAKTFSNRVNEDGSKGFFHPDNFTFGQALYLSKVYEAAMSVEGVSSVKVTTFQRWAKVAAGEMDASMITVGQTEITRLDNDPTRAENGIIEFMFCGGAK